jgi:hypothetical protein
MQRLFWIASVLIVGPLTASVVYAGMLALADRVGAAIQGGAPQISLPET